MAPLMDYNDTEAVQTTAMTRPPTTAKRHFAIVPAKPHDARRLVDIEFHAFETNQVNQILSYRDYKKASHFDRSVRMYETCMQEQLGGKPRPKGQQQRKRADSKLDREIQSPPNASEEAEVLGTTFSKVVDAQSSEIVSFAKVEFKQYTPAELRSPADAGHEGEPAMNRDWFALNERLRREFVGTRKHCYIGMLATAPLHQHHGAGTLLLQQILAQADAAGVEVYLEATDTAKRLYERHGFRVVRELRFDPEEYGVDGVGVERQTVMLRPAAAAVVGKR